MASRAERREEARTEALIKLSILGFCALALLIGGVSGFAGALIALVVLAIVVSVVGFASFLILKSRLVVRKKAGLLLVIGAILTAWVWNDIRATLHWSEARATVTSISGLTAVTETDYTYQPSETRNSPILSVTQVKSWPKLTEAKNYRAGPTAVYYNRSNWGEVSFELTKGTGRATATPVATRIRVTGEGTATLRIGTSVFAMTATTTGPHVVDWTVGSTVPVWINPISKTEFSFQPRTTEPDQKYWMAALAGVCALGGLASLAFGKQWLGPARLPAPTASSPNAWSGGPVFAAPSIADQLRAIDWFQFEAVAARVLESEGWTVQRSGGANPDGGADLLATRDGCKTVVQCKHWRRIEVQPKIIRELLGTMTSAQFTADGAILFTLSECTDAALTCARENNVTIYNVRAIEAAIERIGIERFPELTNPDRKHCPKCGAVMVLRDKSETPFWGCSTYPRCRGTIARA